jgi:16S rRNA processing protein RimM
MRAGRVGRPHGLDGSFYVVEALPGLLVMGAPIEGLGAVVSVKGTQAHPILRVESASDRAAAEALRGRDLVVVGAQPDPLEADEYAAEDLAGCTVVVADGARELGTVKRMLAYPSCELLELEDGTLVPLVRDCVTDVDIAAKRITVDGGFLGAA